MTAVVVLHQAARCKTTLAAALAAKYGTVMVSEQYDGLFQIERGNADPVSTLRWKVSALLDAKHAEEEALPCFFADRGPVDLFNLWMTAGLGRDQSRTADFYNRCRAYVRKYDYIVIPAWGAIPFTQIKDPGNRRRSMNAWYRLHNHASVIGLWRQWVAPEKLLPVPYRLVRLDDRIAYIDTRLSAGSHRDSVTAGLQ